MKIRMNLLMIVCIILFSFTKQIEVYFLLMAFVLLHELGHMIAGLCFRFKVNYLEIMPFGFSLRFQEQTERKEGRIKANVKKVIVAFAGPAVNFLCVLFCIWANIEQVEWIYANLWIGIWNLLPIYPLDGGRILEGILDMRLSYPKKIQYIEKIAKVTVVLLTAIASIIIIYYQNIFIFLGILYLWFVMIQQKINFMKEWY